MAKVVPIRPIMALPDPSRLLQIRRTQMISAWTAWLATEPDAEDVTQEIESTVRAMRSLADLAGIQKTDLFR